MFIFDSVNYLLLEVTSKETPLENRRKRIEGKENGEKINDSREVLEN